MWFWSQGSTTAKASTAGELEVGAWGQLCVEGWSGNPREAEMRLQIREPLKTSNPAPALCRLME